MGTSEKMVSCRSDARDRGIPMNTHKGAESRINQTRYNLRPKKSRRKRKMSWKTESTPSRRTLLQNKESANKERREAEFTRLIDGCEKIAIKNLFNTDPSCTGFNDTESFLDYGVPPPNDVNAEYKYFIDQG